MVRAQAQGRFIDTRDLKPETAPPARTVATKTRKHEEELSLSVSSSCLRDFVVAFEEAHADHSSHLQLRRRPRRPADARPRADPARPHRAAGRRDVHPRDQPSLEDARIDHRAGGGRYPGAGERPRQLPRALLAGRRQPAVLDGADEPARRGLGRRLYRCGLVGGEGDRGSPEGRARARRGVDEGRALRPHPRPARNDVFARCRIRSHHVEQHDRGHAVPTAAGGGRRSTRQRYLLRHVQPADRHHTSCAGLRRRAEEHGTGRRHAGHHSRRSRRPRRPSGGRRCQR